jgi:probable rRNA maturation factor
MKAAGRKISTIKPTPSAAPALRTARAGKTGNPARNVAAQKMPATAMVNVQIATRTPHVPLGSNLRRWARAALGSRAEVTVRIVDAREGRALNRRFRRKDYATNVLSFAYETGRVTRGDIVLCSTVVVREAREQEKSIDAHFAHLTVHGVLHLRGYDHDTAACARTMEGREKRILRGLGFPDPYL